MTRLNITTHQKIGYMQPLPSLSLSVRARVCRICNLKIGKAIKGIRYPEYIVIRARERLDSLISRRMPVITVPGYNGD